jgi:N-acetylglutamate synthase-like GNAT family acetyltransferase
LCKNYDKSHQSIYTKGSVYYLIKLKDIIVGIVHLCIYEDHKAVLNLIAIRKEYQLSGFGSLSIKKIEQLLFKKNKTLLYLNTAKGTESFYQKLDFIRTIDKITSFFPDSITLVKRLKR